MSSPEIFSIIVNNHSGVFLPGDSITGFVFKLFKCQTKNVQITCRGRAIASLDSSPSTFERRLRFKGIQYLIPQTFKQEYFLLSSVCLDEYIHSTTTNESDDDEENDGEGSTSNRHPMLFQFQLKLPSILPPSCSLLYGFINYDILFEYQYVQGPSETVWHQKRVQIPICIGSTVNLNVIPFSAEGAESIKQENFRFLCCNSGNIYSRMAISKMGFVPGEDIYFTIRVKNSATFDVEKIEVTLRKELTFYVGELKKKFCKTLEKIDGPGVEKHSSITWENFLTVPEIPLKFFWPCTVIKISFFLQMKLVAYTLFQRPKTVLENTITILIGDIPVNTQLYLERFPLNYDGGGMNELTSLFTEGFEIGNSDWVDFNCIINQSSNRNSNRASNNQVIVDDSTPSYASLVESPPPTYYEWTMMNEEEAVRLRSIEDSANTLPSSTVQNHENS